MAANTTCSRATWPALWEVYHRDLGTRPDVLASSVRQVNESRVSETWKGRNKTAAFHRECGFVCIWSTKWQKWRAQHSVRVHWPRRDLSLLQPPGGGRPARGRRRPMEQSAFRHTHTQVHTHNGTQHTDTGRHTTPHAHTWSLNRGGLQSRVKGASLP